MLYRPNAYLQTKKKSLRNINRILALVAPKHNNIEKRILKIMYIFLFYEFLMCENEKWGKKKSNGWRLCVSCVFYWLRKWTIRGHTDSQKSKIPWDTRTYTHTQLNQLKSCRIVPKQSIKTKYTNWLIRVRRIEIGFEHSERWAERRKTRGFWMRRSETHTHTHTHTREKCIMRNSRSPIYEWHSELHTISDDVPTHEIYNCTCAKVAAVIWRNS